MILGRQTAAVVSWVIAGHSCSIVLRCDWVAKSNTTHMVLPDDVEGCQLGSDYAPLVS